MTPCEVLVRIASYLTQTAATQLMYTNILKGQQAKDMPTTQTITAGWKAQLIATDNEGCRFFLERYKPFRLNALKKDPDGEAPTLS